MIRILEIITSLDPNDCYNDLLYFVLKVVVLFFRHLVETLDSVGTFLNNKNYLNNKYYFD